MDTLSYLIGKRLRIAREKASTTQEALAAALGFNDRQTISAIEVGERKVTPEELIKAADFLRESLNFFTDPYVVAERHEFSYRATTVDGQILDEFGNRAARLTSAQRRFRSLLGETASPVHSQLPDLTKSTPFNVAALHGERTAAAWGLGPIPAQRLRDIAEEKLGISILFVDGNIGVSGAACRLDDGDVILINRNESEGRRNFDIGHEIFHLLTWQAMPPETLDYEPEDGARKKPRSEQLADSYSGGLLMPATAITERWAKRENQDFANWLRQHSAELLVSPVALYWRLVNLGLITKEAYSLPTAPKAKPAGRRGEMPRLYSRAFVTRLHQVLDLGHLSVLRAIEVLDCS